MIELMKLIFQTLSIASARAYLEQAPQNTIFPYITYKIPSSIDDFQKEDFILEVDLWDNKTDTTALDNLTSAVDALMHRKQHYESGKLQTSIYRINRLMLPDTDQEIRRRQLRYECKTYL